MGQTHRDSVLEVLPAGVVELVVQRVCPVDKDGSRVGVAPAVECKVEPEVAVPESKRVLQQQKDNNNTISPVTHIIDHTMASRMANMAACSSFGFVCITIADSNCNADEHSDNGTADEYSCTQTSCGVSLCTAAAAYLRRREHKLGDELHGLGLLWPRHP